MACIPERGFVRHPFPLAVLALAAACGDGVAPAGPPPVIAAFSASPSVIVAGGASVLTWDVRDATSVGMVGIPGALQGTALLVAPSSDTTYELVATNLGGETRRTVALPVTFPALPPGDPPALRVRGLSGGGVILSWGLAERASGYLVERRAAFEPLYAPLATLGGSQVILADGSATANQPVSYRVRATNAAGSSPGSIASGLSPPPPPEGPFLSISPGSAVVPAGGTALFTSSGPATWAVLEGPAGGTISAAGLYQAPAGAGLWHVAADGGVSAVAEISVP